nr:T9SS type A sorting domain-containing protein [Ignavibacteria bacterium]
MSVFESKLIVGGFFSYIGKIPVRNIAKWNGSNWESFGNTNNAVYSLYTHNSDLYCVGSFTIAGALSANYIAVYKVKPIGIAQISNETPDSYKLSQNFPNPFNPSTTITFSIPEAQFTELEIFDITGRSFGKLLSTKLNPGQYEVKWDASNQPSGVYFYRLHSGKFSITKKMVLIK